MYQQFVLSVVYCLSMNKIDILNGYYYHKSYRFSLSNSKQKQKPGNYISYKCFQGEQLEQQAFFLPHILVKKEKMLLIIFTVVSQKATSAS